MSAADQLVQNISSYIVNPLIVVMFTFALVVFLWGVRAYVSGADNPEARVKGAHHILWGIIGMGLMVMTFAIVRVVLNTFGLTEKAPEVEKVLRPNE